MKYAFLVQISFNHADVLAYIIIDLFSVQYMMCILISEFINLGGKFSV